MTDRYPPFRLDQGGADPVPAVPTSPSPSGPAAGETLGQSGDDAAPGPRDPSGFEHV
jgi:hypothetical protein